MEEQTKGFSCKILADSLHPNGNRLTSMELRYPRPIHCFHPDTEFLSQICDEMPQFRSYAAIVELEAKVGQYSPDDGSVSFVAPLESICEHSDEPLVMHERRSFEFAVTAKHRMFSLRRTTGNAFIPCVDLAEEWVSNLSGARRIPQAASLDAAARVFDQPEEAALIAFYVADGHLINRELPGPQHVSFHFRKMRKVTSVVKLLDALGIEYRHKVYGADHVIKFDPPAWVSQCYSEEGEKRYPDFLYKMSSRCWDAFKTATMESDGNVEDVCINTFSPESAEQTQVLAFLNDTAMNMRSYGVPDNVRRCYKQKYQETPYISFRGDKDSITLVDYSGDVVCFTVPTGFLCVRYHGFAFVSGNSELLTHKRSSRNSASSRAIPIAKMLADIERDPFIPIHWGAAQSGMQAYDEVSAEVQAVAQQKILAHMQQALQLCRELNELGLAKQVVNRYVEPWMWITVVVSGTTSSWANLFALRCHHAAEPHFQKIAKMARQMMKASTPQLLEYGQWHLPYFGFDGDEDIPAADAPKISAARCARISYLTQNGVRDTAEDVKLYDRLVAQEPKHASALEHPAECVQITGCGQDVSYEQAAAWSGNFEHGWRQLRKTVPNEACNVIDWDN